MTWKARIWADSSAPALIAVAQPETLWAPASSATLASAPLVNDGASLTAVTVRVNDRVAVRPPAPVTVRVTVALPLRFAAGVAVRVRFAPEPPRTRFAVGSSEVFDAAAASVSDPAAVSTSPMVMAIARSIRPR